MIDPVNSLNKPEELAAAHAAVSWVLRDATAVAQDAMLAAALIQLDGLNHDLVAAAGDDARAQILQRRVDPAIIEPIEAAWARCA